MTTTPIRLGMIGAGIFAREAHAPALNDLADDFEVVAVYSRTEESAQTLAALFPNKPAIYTDMQALLARDDVEAVDILMPIHLLPATVEAVLAAGKHVISEKPVAPNVDEGRALLTRAEDYPDQVWMVAENWRYEDAFLTARDLIEHGEIGDPLLFHWALHIPLTPDNKYYHTQWRRDNLFQGGYILDGGVHHMAGLRMLLGEVNTVSAIVAQHNPYLPPVDTLSASLAFDSGAIGSYVVSYSAISPWKPLLHLVGTRGTLQMHRSALTLTQGETTRTIDIEGDQSIQAELTDFARVIREGGDHRSEPVEALQDVAIIEAMLRSAEQGVHIQVERLV